MRKPIFFSSVYGIIENDNGETLFAKRAKWANGYHDRFQIPAWHIDGGESVVDALKREMKEELCIDITEFHLAHTVYRSLEDGREYIDFYFKITKYFWEIQIGEPEKCSELIFVALDKLQTITPLKHDEIALYKIQENKNFSEIFLQDSEY